MKKIVLSLAGVMAAVAFAPEASAVPAFARQTGMACQACHFQSYPALTGFGKAFKTAGFTMMGAQGKVEGEHGLSIPDTLNMAIYMQARYKKTGGSDVTAAATPAQIAAGNAGVNNNLSTNSGRIDLPDEFALFVGGRASENIGALVEVNIGTPAAGVAGLKLPVMFDISGTKVGVIPFTNGALGPQYGYDVFATGSTANGRVIENGVGYSASMFIGTGTPVSGLAFLAANETFHVSYTPWAMGHMATNAGVTVTKLGGNYIRAAYTPSMANWDLGLGLQHYSGNALKGVDTAGMLAAGVPAAVIDTVGNANTENKATVIDFQGQGEVAAMPIGIYGSYGWANGQTGAAAVNSFNGGTERKSYFGVLADLGVIPNTLNVQFGFMRGKTGMNEAAVLGTNESDNSYSVGVRYKLAQNAKLGLAYTKFSGSAYNVGGSGGAAVANGAPLAAAGVALAAPANGNSMLNMIFSTAF